MENTKSNLGINALFDYASTDTYRPRSSWTTIKEFEPSDWEMRPKLEFEPSYWWQRLDSNQPHTDFQSAALPDELLRHNNFLWGVIPESNW